MKKLMIITVCFLLALSTTAQDKTDTKMDKKMDAKMGHGKQKDCVMMKDGKMMQMKDGNTLMMEKDMTFTNGAMVMTDGNMKMKDGKTHMLKEGDCVMMDGKMKHMPMKKMKHKM